MPSYILSLPDDTTTTLLGLFNCVSSWFSLQDEEAVKKLTVNPGTKSKLPKPVQNLIKMIFDVESMKKAMVEYEVIALLLYLWAFAGVDDWSAELAMSSVAGLQPETYRSAEAWGTYTFTENHWPVVK